MSLVFVTTCTAEYPRAWIFPTLGLLRDRVICLLDHNDDRPLPVNCERRDYQSPGTIKDGWGLNQGGRFIQDLPGLQDDDVVIIVDTDGVIQRPLEDNERRTLENIGDAVGVSYNVGPGQRGVEEYLLLGPKQPIEDAAKYFKMSTTVLKDSPIYNTGLMAAKVKTWKRLYDFVNPILSNGAAGLFNLRTWPQYIVCCALAANQIPVVELGYETHSHGHFPLTADHEVKHWHLYYKRKLVFFAHNVQLYYGGEKKLYTVPVPGVIR